MNATPIFAGGWVTVPGPGGIASRIVVDDTITTWVGLAAVVTVGVAAGTTKAWVEAATEILKVVVLRASTAATDTASGLQRPDDYHAVTNIKCWHQVSA